MGSGDSRTEKVGGQHKCLSCMVVFRCFDDYVAMIYLIKPHLNLRLSLNMN